MFKGLTKIKQIYLNHKPVNLLQPNISMYILKTVLYKFSKVLTKRIQLFNNQELLELVIIPLIPLTLMFDSGVILHGEIRC